MNRRGRLAVAAVCVLTACSGAQSVLDTRGPAAERIAGLWWLLLALASAVYLTVIGFLLAAALRRRRDDEGDAHASAGRGVVWVAVGGAALPAIILTLVFAVTLLSLSHLHPPAPGDGLTIQVTGWQWWWEIRYSGVTRDEDVVTANEIHIPTGRRVRIEMTSGDVIHSFWVPNLQGKTDLVPGRTSVSWIQADRPGVSRGQCAEYCGMQHANMALLVVAEEPAQFERWLADQRRAGAAPADPLAERGRAAFLGLPCAYCHAVRGTPALGRLGPDLTHLGSRRTIAAGTLTNTREHLTRWIAEPQRVKPGNRMPPSDVTQEQLRALVHYLESLR